MASDEKSRERRNPIGPTARTVGHNLRRLRLEAGDTQASLAGRLAENGHPIPVASIGRIESGDRRVEVDDLVALAVALGVSPLALLLPAARKPSDDAALTGWGESTAGELWTWALGMGDLIEMADPDSMARSFPLWVEERVRRFGREDPET